MVDLLTKKIKVKYSLAYKENASYYIDLNNFS
jgi:hypothetical protein